MYHQYYLGANRFDFEKFKIKINQAFRFRMLRVTHDTENLSIIIECAILGRAQLDKEFELEVSSYVKGYLDAIL